MSLIKCSECSNSVSDKAAACPHCGCPVSEMQPTNKVVAVQKNNTSNRWIVIIVAVVVALCTVFVVQAVDGSAELSNLPNSTEKSSYITVREYNKLETGITYEKAKIIIGGDGELISETDIGYGSEYTTKIYCWYEKDGLSNACLTFQGNKLISKAQVGLQ